VPSPSIKLLPGDRLLSGVGLVALGFSTLIYPASSQIYASPVSFAYGLLLAVPVVAILLHSATQATWSLPSQLWTYLPLSLGLIILTSAWISPYQTTVLRWSAGPLAGIALFFWVHGWLQPSRATRLEVILTGLALGTAIFTLVSFGRWGAMLIDHGFGPGVVDWLGMVRNPFPLGHSNYTAGAIVLGLPFVVRAAARAQRTVRTAWIIAAFLAVFVLFTSGSRGGLLGLIILGILGVVSLRLRPRYLAATLILGAIIGATLAFSHPRIREFLRPDDPSAPPNISSVQRLAMARAGWLMGVDRPLLGWGLHSTPLVFPRYRVQLTGGAENVLQLHSAPVEIWAGLGAAGVLAGIGLFGLALAGWRRQPTAAVALLGYAGFSLTDYQLDLPIIVTGLAFIGATLASPARKVFRLHRAARTGIAAGLIVSSGLVLLIGREDPAPRLNVAALTLAQDPQLSAQAIAILEDSLSLNPDQEIAHFNLGWLQVMADPVAAETHFRAAIHLVPDKGGVYFGLGLARLNQGHLDGAAYAFALECLNDPSFIRSPWWGVTGITPHHEKTRSHFIQLVDHLASQLDSKSWAFLQLSVLRKHADQLGTPQPGPARALRHERSGYPVLMRNLDIPRPVDLFDMRESFSPASTDLPAKGWLPTPLLLSLLDQGPSPVP
jgi:O-antigen ligase